MPRVAGAIDPLEESVAILLGTVRAALAGCLSRGASARGHVRRSLSRIAIWCAS